jgi:hypothetical protein
MVLILANAGHLGAVPPGLAASATIVSMQEWASAYDNPMTAAVFAA